MDPLVRYLTGDSPRDENPSVADIRHKFVGYSSKFVVLLSSTSSISRIIWIEHSVFD